MQNDEIGSLLRPADRMAMNHQTSVVGAMQDNSAITVRLKPTAMAKIRELGRRHGYEPNQLALLGLTLAKVILEEKERGNKIIIADANGIPLIKLKLPPRPHQMNTKTPLEDDPFHSDPLLRAIADLDPDGRRDIGPSSGRSR